ncbi:hypothetical protein EN836_27870 [Mesorhizobium sp. M1C.F.Ca.ET.193.01.1.1]|uniref:hypothetical protein n=1 Tax=unclassified Mesorhizobium TaxID=325217 RepID=UPI000FD410D3|nr:MULTISPECIES: hypothetical protein [unclassified Mesorhizobium]TGS93419.1 hypothetical protein EN820_48535 [bacterium M00.F.Ca.ET.177.01.1.1]TGQ50707.1 hypothetical protein EN853_27865 [Mesorhizobium sp. M1C.F.Ca.ET.210.01.1.1]TGQ65873.1 hypothetical protein EN855_027875 [Mesorhizobium sp. M1C.F.Ca.ET.212.01.1.1]TGQ99878.1 hypothetical protein EN847_27865 [Mesorhizobium sp. M1C.F.Ca.ET.204.01.1.1]TGR20412.1 hypothetical protein EN839_27865 [Mesorhizobium sp. M1C.F.Ca.ET.196.01.1.1]
MRAIRLAISYENAREFSIFACTLEDLILVKLLAHFMVGEMLPGLTSVTTYPASRQGSMAVWLSVMVNPRWKMRPAIGSRYRSTDAGNHSGGIALILRHRKRPEIGSALIDLEA